MAFNFGILHECYSPSDRDPCDSVLYWCSDVPTKEYILNLNESKSTNDRFVILDLDDTHLFVQPTVVEWLEKQLKEFHDQNTYQPPRREDAR